MYKILGGDGKEYGPVSAETLQQWIREGRANSQTQVQLEGSVGWTALGLLSDFAGSFAGPVIPGAGAPSGAPTSGMPGNAPRMTSGPAIGLIVTAAIGALAQLGGLLMNVLGVGLAGMNTEGQQAVPAWANALSGGLGIVINLIGMAMAVVVFMGALKMKNLQSYGFAMTATIVAMVPCVSPCCWIGLPVGVWALVVLCKPEVKASFS